MKSFQAKISSQTPIHYYVDGNKDANHAYLLLHGYGQNGKVFLDRLKPLFKDSDLIISLNAPFPIPQKITHKDGSMDYKLGFAWYFYNPYRNEYYLDYQYSAEIIIKLLEELKQNSSFDKISILGYSQGGYLAPFIAQELEYVKKLICLGCVLKADLLEGPFTSELIQIQSKDDEAINFSGAELGYKNFIQQFSPKVHSFIQLENEKHSLWNKSEETQYFKHLRQILS